MEIDFCKYLDYQNCKFCLWNHLIKTKRELIVLLSNKNEEYGKYIFIRR